eukprot:CAMPEP_0172665574 /NCGR_PEP_ID=MMETSP1074-20121228/7341_1 /TAXON_ID=2916 /ORGANISM="Ceratium fusus, Strain PA161109" /LENGTH=129 /DNA_ID=CAMNT_0013481915 /DNA_START=44 /DNA_END=433 /DNA_ORIENTATION=+
MALAAARLTASVPVAGPIVGMATGFLTKDPWLLAQGTICLTIDLTFAAQDAVRAAAPSGALSRTARANASTRLDSELNVAKQLYTPAEVFRRLVRVPASDLLHHTGTARGQRPGSLQIHNSSKTHSFCE